MTAIEALPLHSNETITPAGGVLIDAAHPPTDGTHIIVGRTFDQIRAIHDWSINNIGSWRRLTTTHEGRLIEVTANVDSLTAALLPLSGQSNGVSQ